MSSISFTAITDGSSIDASDVNGPLNTIYDDYNGSIDSNNLADNAVTTAKITDANITTAKIADANVTMPKISNPYIFYVYRKAAYTGIADATLTTVDFDAELFDVNNNFDLTSNQYTIPVTGYYHFDCQIRMTGTAIVDAGAYLYGGAAGTTQLTTTIHTLPTATEVVERLSNTIYCTAGDLMSIRIYVNVTGTATVIQTKDVTYFSGYLVAV